MRRMLFGFGVGLLLGTLFLAVPAAQNYVWGAINGIPFAPQVLWGGAGVFGPWTRTGTVLSPTTAGDTVRLGVGTASVNPISFHATDLNMGFFSGAAGAVGNIATGSGINTFTDSGGTVGFSSGSMKMRALGYMLWSSTTTIFGSDDLVLGKDAAGTLQIGQDVNGSPVAQTLKAHDGITGTDIAGANLILAGGRGTGAGAPGQLIIQTAPALTTGTTAQTLATQATFTAAYGLQLAVPSITAGSGTGITVADTGSVRRQVYKVTVDRTALIANATTQDVTLATLPAKTRVVGIYANVTTTFACTGTCTTATLSITAGKSAGGNEYLASFDADAATAVFGDADAECGTALTRAARIQDADLPNFAGTTTLSMRFTSGTGNIGNGAATNLSQGVVTFYILTEILP